MSNEPYIFFVVAVLIIVCILIVGCDTKRPVASDYERNETHAIAPTHDTALRRAIAPEIKEHHGQSGFKLLTKGDDSLMLRIAMIEAAERSLDIQYYIIINDVTGKLLLEALLRAADRGIRVRILMDDLNLRGSDATWSLLNSNHNIEIRVFNPFATIDEPLLTRISSIFTGLHQFTKRMHNKILITDNQVGITGGRNLGDSYFDASSDFNFRDVDVLAVGPIVPHLSKSFDRYWNNDEAFPLSVLHKINNDPKEVAKLREQLRLNWQEAMQKGNIAVQTPLATQLKNEKIPLIWARAELGVDSPSKINLPEEIVESKPELLINKIAEQAEHEFIIVSPYFVPGEEKNEELQSLVKRGVKVRILTNSLASTDVVAVHTGYSRYRQELVKEGVELYEMKPIPGTRPRSRRFSSSSRNSLHSKIYVADRRDVIIGSFNLDPRSVNLNTELVILIHSAVLGEQVISMFEKAIHPATSFHVVMEDNQLKWESEKDGKEQQFEAEPEAGFWRKIKANLFALLPFEGQL